MCARGERITFITFIHVCQSPPPYVSTPIWTKPSPRFLDTGFIRRHGESVWAPTMQTGFPGLSKKSTCQHNLLGGNQITEAQTFHLRPIAKATIVEELRVR